MTEPAQTHCKKHPKVETTLRCSKCETPICPKCAILTAVGYRCADCGREKSAIDSTPLKLLIPGALFGFTMGFLLTWLVGGKLGFFVLFLGAILGTFVGEAIIRLVKRHRSMVVSVSTVAGFFAGAFFEPIQIILKSQTMNVEQMGRVLFSDFWAIGFALIASAAAWQRMRF